MKSSYVLIIAIVAVIMGYVAGIEYGRDGEGDSWRQAVLSIESDACRDAVRDALGRGGRMRD